MLKLRSLVAAAAALLIVPAAAHAQRALPASFAPKAFAPALAPAAAPAVDSAARPFAAESADSSAVATRDAADVLAPSDHANVGPNVGLMIIGGAAIITGSVIGGSGGTLIAVGGAVVGLYGLYKYLH
jgi:hypothetical protein